MVAVFDLMPKAKRWFGVLPILVWESLGHSLACLMCIGENVTVGWIYFADVIKWCVATTMFLDYARSYLGCHPKGCTRYATGGHWQLEIQLKKAIGMHSILFHHTTANHNSIGRVCKRT